MLLPSPDFMEQGRSINDLVKSKFHLQKRGLHESYREIDVCDSVEKLISTTVDILLNPKYLLGDSWQNIKSSNKTLLVFIATYLTPELYKLLLEIMSMSKISVVTLNSASDSTNAHINTFTVPYQNLMVGLFRNFRQFQWHQVLIIRFATRNMTLEDDLHETFYKRFLFLMEKEKNVCFKTSTRKQ